MHIHAAVLYDFAPFPVYLSHAYSCCGLLQLVRLVGLVLASFRNELRLYVILALFVEITRLVVFVFESFFFFLVVGSLFQCFLVVIAVVKTSRLGFRRVPF